MREVKAARERGLPVMGETCTQYLVLSIEDDMGKPGFADAKYVFTPPLRKKSLEVCQHSRQRPRIDFKDHGYLVSNQVWAIPHILVLQDFGGNSEMTQLID